MVLTFDIRKKAEPVIRQTHKVSTLAKSGDLQSLNENLSDLILMIEGFDNHVFALSKAEAKSLLDETVKVMAIFINIDEEIDYSKDNEIAEKFKYTLKALYKLKSLLHIAYTKDKSVKKTPEEIKEGLSPISRNSVLHILSKRSI